MDIRSIEGACAEAVEELQSDVCVTLRPAFRPKVGRSRSDCVCTAMKAEKSWRERSRRCGYVPIPGDLDCSTRYLNARDGPSGCAGAQLGRSRGPRHPLVETAVNPGVTGENSDRGSRRDSRPIKRRAMSGGCAVCRCAKM